MMIRRSVVLCQLAIPVLVAFLVTVGVAQSTGSQDLSDVTVDRFEVDSFRLKDGQRITCWIRNTAWRGLGPLEAELEVTDAEGEKRTFSFARISRLPAGRVVEVRTKIRGVSDPQEYHLLIRRTDAPESDQRVIKVEPSTNDTRPKPLQAGSGGRTGNKGSGSGYPRKLHLGLSSSFGDGNNVEVGHLTVWKTDEQRIEVQGGVRNGADKDLMETTVTFTLTDSSGETSERSFEIGERLRPGQIHPFSESFDGVEELKALSYNLSYKSVSPEGGNVSMNWPDVRNQLSAPGETERSSSSNEPSTDHPLLSLRGMKTVAGRLDGSGERVELYLLKAQMTYRSRAVRPNGKIVFEVIRKGNVKLSKEYALRADAYKPFPDAPDVADFKPGTVYWRPDAKVLYIALFATDSIRSPSALRVQFKVRDAGFWTFERLEPPYMNGFIPPDHVRER